MNMTMPRLSKFYSRGKFIEENGLLVISYDYLIVCALRFLQYNKTHDCIIVFILFFAALKVKLMIGGPRYRAISGSPHYVGFNILYVTVLE